MEELKMNINLQQRIRSSAAILRAKQSPRRNRDENRNGGGPNSSWSIKLHYPMAMHVMHFPERFAFLIRINRCKHPAFCGGDVPCKQKTNNICVALATASLKSGKIIASKTCQQYTPNRARLLHSWSGLLPGASVGVRRFAPLLLKDR
jgi:hypothetical protein